MENKEKPIRNVVTVTTKYYGALWVLALVTTFVISQYFNWDSWASIVSFYPNEPPGNVKADCLPKPLGVHYFGDLVSFSCHSMEQNPYFPPIGFNYFPLAYIIGKPFGWLLREGLIYALVLFVALFAQLVFILQQVRHKENPQSNYPIYWVIAIVLLSSPGIATLDRGNIQLLVFVAMAVWLRSEVSQKSVLGAIWLGMAAGIKGYPAFFALYYVKRKEWRALATFSTSALLSFIVPLLVMGNGVVANSRLLLEQLQTFRDAGSVDSITRYNTSLRSLLAVLSRTAFFGELLPSLLLKAVEFVSENYTFVGAFLMLFIAVLSLSRAVELFEFTTLGAVACCLLPDLVATYVLGFFWLPLFALDPSRLLNPYRQVVVILVSVILVPKGIPIFDSQLLFSLTSIINPLAMIAILVVTGLSVAKSARSRLRTL